MQTQQIEARATWHPYLLQTVSDVSPHNDEVRRPQGQGMSIDDRLENWSRYYRDRLVYQVCGSMEGKLYRAPWRQWVELSQIGHPMPVDWRDAEAVENAWRKLSGKPKLILKYRYMCWMPDIIVARKSKVKIYRLEAELGMAKRLIADILAE